MRDKNLYVIKASAGTGKTYTLAAHYIALLMYGVPYRNILAVTFTNKATAEMKERITTYLHAIARESNREEVQQFLHKVHEVAIQRGLCADTEPLPVSNYQQQAERLLPIVLSDYDNMKIMTIDSFLQTLLAGMAQVIGQAFGYAVELDSEHTITEAIDRLMTQDVAEREDIRQFVTRCLNDRLDRDQPWDLRRGLIRMAKMMYKEDVQQIRDHIVFPATEHPDYAERLSEYRKKQDWHTLLADEITQLKELLKDLGDLKKEDISNGLDFTNWIDDIKDSVADIAEKNAFFRPLGKRALKNLDLLTDPTKPSYKGTGDAAMVERRLRRAMELVERCRRIITRTEVVTRYLDDLMLVGYVIDRIRRDLRANNTILLAETAATLLRAMDEQDAQFVLLKAGIRYRHIMLDEFQDTSTLQWGNFHRLVHEIVSQVGGSTLIVGDVKQSIYRWRSGDYSIMAGLDQDPALAAHYESQSLTRNFRSRKAITQTVEDLFASIAQETDEQQLLYKELIDAAHSRPLLDDVLSANDGFVGLWSYDTNDKKAAEATMLRQMFEHMEQMLSSGYLPSDLMILVRNGKTDGKYVLQAFAETIRDTERFPHLSKAGKIISADSYHLDSSVSVNIIISVLKYLYLGDQVALAYVEANMPEVNPACQDVRAVIAELDRFAPLGDVIEQVISRLLCGEDGLYPGKDIAHLNGLRDNVRSYVGKYGSAVEEFLQYWDDKMHLKGVQSAEGADIRLMTIHTAKGLEAKNVFIPFCNWEMETSRQKAGEIWCAVDDLLTDDEQAAMLPIHDDKQMPEAGFEAEYEMEHRKQRIDNLNLLYVALTRPEDNLFVYILQGKNDVGELLCRQYTLEGDDHREIGTLYSPCRKPEEKKPDDKQPPKSKSEPFSFVKDDTQTLIASYSGEHAEIQFRQSQRSRDIVLHGADSAEYSGREWGILCHEIMAHVRQAADVERVVDEYFCRGYIPSRERRDEVLRQIRLLIEHPVAQPWFDGSWQLMREDAILVPNMDGRLMGDAVVERRMDRVMIRGEQAIVLDYKFGAMQPKYKRQVREYIDILSRMGYKNVRGYLWIAPQNELIEI